MPTSKEKKATARIGVFEGKTNKQIIALSGLDMHQVKTQRKLVETSGINFAASAFSTTEASILLNLHERAVRRWCSLKVLGEMVGGRYVITRKELLSFRPPWRNGRKVTELEVMTIRKSTKDASELARIYSIDQSQVHRILNRKSWAWVK